MTAWNYWFAPTRPVLACTPVIGVGFVHNLREPTQHRVGQVVPAQDRLEGAVPGAVFDGLYEFYRCGLLLGPGTRATSDEGAVLPYEQQHPDRWRVRPRVGVGVGGFRRLGAVWCGGADLVGDLVADLRRPAGQIAVMQRVLVEEKRWIGQRRFLHALSYCTLLPGPEAQQLAIYIGWLLNGTRGGLVAGTLFVLPGVIALLALSAVYVAFGAATAVTALFAGLAPAVLAIVTQAVIRVGRRALAHPALVALALAAFLALAVFAVPFPVVVAAAAALGWALGRLAPHVVAAAGGHGSTQDGPAPVIADDALHTDRPTGGRAARVLLVGLALWAAPVVAVAVLTGTGSVFTRQSLFFSGAAVVTFGGAYAVLAYVAQRAVEVFHWLAPGEMVRGLALAETTPGPLIMVVQFVAFVGAYRNPGTLNPWVAAVLGALLTTWVTFVPCFLFIFLGAPYVERLRGNRTLSAALAGITAAVVGVIANLAVYFALHTLFARTGRHEWGPVHVELPDPTSLRPVALAISAAAAGMIFRFRWSVLRTLGVCALLGLATTPLT